MFSQLQLDHAAQLLDALRRRGLTLVTAESCTGGLVAALLTSIPGSSEVFDRGFITYSNDAKREALGVDREILETYGAVSAETAAAMADGALSASHADIAISVTGVAGPGGGTPDKPVGLVYFATALKNAPAISTREAFGAIERDAIRLRSVTSALDCIAARLAHIR